MCSVGLFVLYFSKHQYWVDFRFRELKNFSRDFENLQQSSKRFN